jgi:hypothetical protein
MRAANGSMDIGKAAAGSSPTTIGGTKAMTATMDTTKTGIATDAR